MPWHRETPELAVIVQDVLCLRMQALLLCNVVGRPRLRRRQRAHTAQRQRGYRSRLQSTRPLDTVNHDCKARRSAFIASFFFCVLVARVQFIAELINACACGNFDRRTTDVAQQTPPRSHCRASRTGSAVRGDRRSPPPQTACRTLQACVSTSARDSLSTRRRCAASD